MGVDYPEQLRDEAVSIAEAAGQLMLEAFGGPVATSTKKTRSDLVTEVDLASERLVRERISAAFPDHHVVGEEEGGSPDHEAVWYVDPIDGTTNFAHGHPWFCISLGFARNGRLEAGVVHAPAMGLTFAAAKGHGATRNGQPVSVSRTEALADSLLATGFPPDRATNPDNNYDAFLALDRATHGVRRCAAAALELAHVASGGYDGFWDIGLAPWDLAAGALLIEEAGGRVTGLTGEPFDLHDGAVVAASPAIHEPLVSALAHARRLNSPSFAT